MAIPRNLANLANQLNTDGEAPKIEVGDSSVAITDTGSNGTITFTTDNAERMRITAAGNVGINTTSPEAITNYKTLEVKGDTTSAGGIFQSTTSDNSVKARFFTNNNGGLINVVTNHDLLLFTNNTERARITSGGDFLVGTTTTTAKFNVTNGSEQQISQYINNTNSSPVGVQIRYATDVNAGANRFIDCIGNATSRFIIYSNGNAVNTNGSYGTISDIKLKENIVDATPKLEDVLKLQVRNFNLKSEPDNKQIGFIAQEFEQVFPSMVENTIDNEETKEVTKAIKTSVLIPILVKAIQELSAKNDAIEARLAALEAK